MQPHAVEEDEAFAIEVAMLDAGGSLVPLSGIEICVRGAFVSELYLMSCPR